VALEELGGNFVRSTDHYATAVDLLARKHTGHSLTRAGRSTVDADTRPPTPEEVAQVQVHATLALVNVAGELVAELAMIREHLPRA
jgi:hypothetical protein